MLGDKLRFRFRKTGDLRLIGHNDLMRSAERLMRRARVPFKSTAGFHPTPRFVLALSLPLGVEGRDEVAEIELTEPLDSEAVRGRLNEQAPAGLHFFSARVVEPKASAVPRRAEYRLPLPPDRVPAAAAACADLMARDKVWAERIRPKPRRVNIRSYLRRLGVEDNELHLDLWVTQTGTARAEELMTLLGVQDLATGYAPLARTVLEIHDETPAGGPDAPPPEGPPETAPLDLAADSVSAADEPATPAATWGLSPNGPVVE